MVSPSDVELSKQFTLVMLQTYREAARIQLEEAEVAIERGIALREHALQMMERANVLALKHAQLVEELELGDQGPNW